MRWLHLLRTFRTWIVALPRPATGLLLGALCALVVQAALSLGWLSGLERGTLDALFRARGKHFGAPQIVLVIANDETISRYNTWPLPRRVYADLIQHLHRDGAKTIAFDILFSEASPHPADDRALVTACKTAGNVIQAGALHVEGIYNPTLPVSASGLSSHAMTRFVLRERSEKPASELDAVTGSMGTDSLPSAVWMSAPLPDLLDSAPLLGHINVHPRPDGALRTIPHAIRYRNDLFPSLALAAAAHYLDVPARQIEVGAREITIAGRHLPMESDGETGINWAGGNGTFVAYPITRILDGDVPADAIKDKIVLIGATAAGSYEYRATPFSSVQPALEVQVNALDNILQNRPLHFTDAGSRFLLLLGFSMLAGLFIAPRLDLGGALLLSALCGVLWLIAWWFLKNRDLYLPVAPPIVAAAFTYALAMAINYREQWEANFRGDASVAILARGGALMASGHDRARLENVIQRTALDALNAEKIILVHGDEADQLLRTLSETLHSHQRAMFHPFPRRASSLEKPFAPGPELARVLTVLGQRVSPPEKRHKNVPAVVAAPVIQTKAAGVETPSLPSRKVFALVAIGARGGRSFGFRDAILLETLAEQAGMALENLEYQELLQGRVELANRDLREAYGVLSEQSAKFMAAVESIDDALVICDATGAAVFTNGGASPTLGAATPHLGQNLPELLRAHNLETIADLYNCFQLQPAEDAPRVQCEPVRCEVEDGGANAENVEAAPRVLSAQLTPLYADSGQPIGSMLLVADVTVQRELDQMKSDFVSFVAHELRSPLGAILGYASLLQQYGDKADSTMRNEMTESIARQCKRLNRLVGDLLDISRLDAGRPLDLRREKVELKTLIERVLDAQRASLNTGKITLQFACEESSVSIWGDPDRLEQIFINLVSNAVKYSPDGGEVRIELQSANDGAKVAVRDPGMGMTPEQIENLFQKYYRTPDARLRGIKGTGLGLYLVKNLVEAHDGTIEVESAFGQGTTFSVWLPAGTPEGLPSPFAASELAGTTGSSVGNSVERVP